MELCPCGSGAAFTECCGAVIAGTAAATPEALMRARYTAFLRGEIGFLEDTMAPEKKDEFDRVEVEESAKDAKGQGFEVRAVDGDNVEYVARFKMRGQPYVHHERALFRQEDGRWLYVDGEVNPKQPPRQVDKVGRNDPCPCGSGQKYKKCCGA